MNEEQLADLLAQHLDTLLEGGALPEDLPAEVAELLTVAQSLAETAPAPRPEFGPLLQESLLGPSGGGNGAPPTPGSTLSGHVMSMVVVGLLAGAAILAVLLSVFIYSIARSNLSESSPTPAPAQTQTTPAQSTPAPAVTAQATLETPTTPTITATPVLDILPPITVTVEIIIEPPDLVPGSGGGGDGGDSGGGGGSSGDHDRGHGNDSDHNDEDNPGRGGGGDD
jgi:hypothetical protein